MRFLSSLWFLVVYSGWNNSFCERFPILAWDDTGLYHRFYYHQIHWRCGPTYSSFITSWEIVFFLILFLDKDCLKWQQEVVQNNNNMLGRSLEPLFHEGKSFWSFNDAPINHYNYVIVWTCTTRKQCMIFFQIKF